MPRIEWSGSLDLRGDVQRRFPAAISVAEKAAERVMRSGFAHVAAQAAKAAPRRTGRLAKNVYWGRQPIAPGVVRYHVTMAAFYASWVNKSTNFWTPFESQLIQVTHASGCVALKVLVSHLARDVLDLFGDTLTAGRSPWIITHKTILR